MVDAKPVANTESTKSELPVVASPKTLPEEGLELDAPPTLEDELEEDDPPPPELLQE